MSIVNRCSLLPIDAWIFPITSMVVVRGKLSTDPWIDQPACCGLGREPFFLGAMYPFNSVNNFMKGCHVWGLPTRSVRVTYVDWYAKHTCHLYQVFPTGCTSI
jgi:hypothetical protein